MELQLRLQDPVFPCKQNQHDASILERNWPTRSEHFVATFVPHVFDIDYHGSSLQIWLDIEQRNRHMALGDDSNTGGPMETDKMANHSLQESMLAFITGRTMGPTKSVKNEVPIAKAHFNKQIPCLYHHELPHIRSVRFSKDVKHWGRPEQYPSDEQAPCNDEQRTLNMKSSEYITNTESSATSNTSGEQPSLLQVFETELAGRSSKGANLDGTSDPSFPSGSTFLQQQPMSELLGSSNWKARSKAHEDSGIPNTSPIATSRSPASIDSFGVNAHFDQDATSSGLMLSLPSTSGPFKQYPGNSNLPSLPSPHFDTKRRMTSRVQPPDYIKELYTLAQSPNEARDRFPQQTIPVSTETAANQRSQSLANLDNGSYSSSRATRFPTLEQFMDRSFAGMSDCRFLSSVEPLLPLCSPNQAPGPPSYKTYNKPLRSNTATGDKISKSSLQLPKNSSVPTKESSGEFHKRMTGEDTNYDKNCPFETLQKRSHNHYDGRTQELHEWKGFKGPDTSLSSGMPYLASYPRPYHKKCSGNDTLSVGNPLLQNWNESNIRVGRQESTRIKQQFHTPGTSKIVGNHAPSIVGITAVASGEVFTGKEDLTIPEKVRISVQKLRNLDSGDSGGGDNPQVFYAEATEGSLSNAIDMIKEVQLKAGSIVPAGPVAGMASHEVFTSEHSDPATVAQVQACVEKLQDLGFGGSSSQIDQRLAVYAQAAEGNVSDAIDLIDEEQRAYSELQNR